MKAVAGIVFLFSFLMAAGQATVGPVLKVKCAGAVTDFSLDGNTLILSTDAGTVSAFDLTTHKKKLLLRLPESTDFMGDPIPTKVYSVDELDGKLLLVTQGLHGFRNLIIVEDGKTVSLLDAATDRMMIKKARWLAPGKVLLALLGNDVILFDTQAKKIIRSTNVSPYTFSDFALSEDKKFVFTTDESGIVHRIELEKLQEVETFSGMNVDNVYRLDYRNGTVVTAGQDRRVGVYNTLTGDHFFLQQPFLVYAIGLSSDGGTAAFYANEKNDIAILDLQTRQLTAVLKGHESVVTQLLFYDGNSKLVSAGDDGYLMVWKF